MPDKYYVEEIPQSVKDMSEMKSTRHKKERFLDNAVDGAKPILTMRTKKASNSEVQLCDIKEQLEMAETRCNSLRGQVEYMKMLYDGMNSSTTSSLKNDSELNLKRISPTDIKENSVLHKKMVYNAEAEETQNENVDIKSKSHIQTEEDTNRELVNQNNKQNVNDIVHSINKYQKFEDIIAQRHNKDVSKHIEKSQIKTNTVKPHLSLNTEDKEKGIKYKKPILQKLKEEIASGESGISINTLKRRKTDRKQKPPTTAGTSIHRRANLRVTPFKSLLIRKSVIMPSPEKYPSKLTKSAHGKLDNLKDVYCNNTQLKVTSASEINVKGINVLKNSKMDITENYEHQNENPLLGKNKETLLPPIEEQEQSSMEFDVKNYELPTIASKLKQVTQAYFENFTFRTIPFVPVKSVTPSHNLGLNIQQVLSIIKGHKPAAGIPSTLAYNIELAADKYNLNPLSSIVSTLGTKMNSRMCPVGECFSTTQLQELAKEIPDDLIQKVERQYEEKIKNCSPKERSWRKSKNDLSRKCTCIPMRGRPFSEVYRKYVTHNKNEKSQAKLKNIRENLINKTLYGPGNINRKEKSLKLMFKNLCDEFKGLHSRYGELKGQINNGSANNKEIMQEIGQMERILQKKEEEISVVMSLYKGVLALRPRVKQLKQQASQVSFTNGVKRLDISSKDEIRQNDKENKESNPAAHLVKLLRRVQLFQEKLETNVN